MKKVQRRPAGLAARAAASATENDINNWVEFDCIRCNTKLAVIEVKVTKAGHGNRNRSLLELRFNARPRRGRCCRCVSALGDLKVVIECRAGSSATSRRCVLRATAVHETLVMSRTATKPNSTLPLWRSGLHPVRASIQSRQKTVRTPRTPVRTASETSIRNSKPPYLRMRPPHLLCHYRSGDQREAPDLRCQGPARYRRLGIRCRSFRYAIARPPYRCHLAHENASHRRRPSVGGQLGRAVTRIIRFGVASGGVP
jgi:hypothetical protein